jgi:peptidoglycan glycosyltransferase
VANPNTAAKLKDALPQASYGQGQVVASPLQLARVAATIANNGAMPYGRWVIDDSNARVEPDKSILQPELARTLGQYMRSVVTNGTGRSAAKATVAIAGKTGTAELAKGASHAWFIGFAPFTASGRRIAFAVLVENGQYGGAAAAPIAADVVSAASQLGLFNGPPAEAAQ